MEKKKLSQDEKSVLEQYIIPFYNANKRHPLFPGRDSVQAEADLLGISVEELQEYRLNLDQNAKQAALELLKEDEIIDLLDKIPFDGNEIIVALGDSSTEDAQGWFNIFKNLLEISSENAEFQFINAGISGNTTTDGLRRLDRDVLLAEPDWVFVSLGTFDVQRLNIAPDRTLIPLSETWENLNTIQEILEEQLENPVIWLTPTPVIQELLEENLMNEFSIDEMDMAQLIEVVAGKRGVIIDPQGRRLGEEKPQAWNYLSDGLNPSLAGHTNTVREILKMMAQVDIKS